MLPVRSRCLEHAGLARCIGADQDGEPLTELNLNVRRDLKLWKRALVIMMTGTIPQFQGTDLSKAQRPGSQNPVLATKSAALASAPFLRDKIGGSLASAPFSRDKIGGSLASAPFFSRQNRRPSPSAPFSRDKIGGLPLPSPFFPIGGYASVRMVPCLRHR